MQNTISAIALQVENVPVVGREVPYMETEWECMECGFLHEGKTPPRRCPDCGSSDAWEKVEYVDDWDDDELDDKEDLDEDEYND